MANTVFDDDLTIENVIEEMAAGDYPNFIEEHTVAGPRYTLENEFTRLHVYDFRAETSVVAYEFQTLIGHSNWATAGQGHCATTGIPTYESLAFLTTILNLARIVAESQI